MQFLPPILIAHFLRAASITQSTLFLNTQMDENSTLMMHTLLTSRGLAVELGQDGKEGVRLALESH